MHGALDLLNYQINEPGNAVLKEEKTTVNLVN